MMCVYRCLPPNRPLQPPGTRLQAGAARRAGSRQRLSGSVRPQIAHAGRVSGQIPLLVLCCAALLTSCVSFRYVSSDEVAIIATALDVDWSPLGMGSREPSVGFHDRTLLEPRIQLGDGDTGCYIANPEEYTSAVSLQCLPIAPELKDILRAVNQHPAGIPFGSLPPWAHAAPERRPFYAVSRPAIARSGNEALIAIAYWSSGTCSTGWTLYLTRASGTWRVTGYGGWWIT
jgi:hypothetical protein